VFDENKRVVVSAPYVATWAQFVTQFATTPYRRSMATRFEQWVSACAEIVRIEYVWIGGSFCSDKAEPKDIDAALFYHYLTYFPQQSARDAFLQQHGAILSNRGS
jgi:hypothetical protein